MATNKDPYYGLDQDAIDALIASQNQSRPSTSTGSSNTGSGSSGSYGGSTGGSYAGSVNLGNISTKDFDSDYARKLNSIANELGNREFSYNYATDPLYQQYEKQYMRNGQRAMEDTLGRTMARTGGMGNSYAASASQQAYNDYMSALSGKIPELQQIAFQMYQDENKNLLNQADLYQQLYNNDLKAYQAEMAAKQALANAQLKAQATGGTGGSSSGGGYSGSSSTSSGSGIDSYTPVKVIEAPKMSASQAAIQINNNNQGGSNAAKLTEAYQMYQNGQISASTYKELENRFTGVYNGMDM